MAHVEVFVVEVEKRLALLSDERMVLKVSRCNCCRLRFGWIITYHFSLLVEDA